ncbi:SMI1/KNR4 family protein [Gracilibacillus thailandensis]|uniref:SMI1/KNR4 family protein n=1 Tax=Gracilibacillus thailandensis TaxID=563735 RepID=A0A6N7QV93_9BACI|nr:SMI1/KNR4 family protein [Gracilibacillus thailandensis]MRI65928.1 SMI1/KNR4 family protein [Gracilibacillus thailandensis]
MNKEELINFIKRNMEPDDFTGGVDGKQIEYVQDTLKLKLPESYKWFLNNYGSGGLYGVDILGVAKSNIATVVIETESYRDLGMSENLVVIEDIDEYAYCLDTGNMENNECPVIAWNKQGGLDDYNTAENFYEFLSQRLLDAKEAWEEDF